MNGVGMPSKLKTLKPQIATIKPLIGRATGDEKARHRERDTSQQWRQWYKTSRWQKLRWSILVRDNFTCQRCGRVDVSKNGLHCDHTERHGGDEARFWSGPFQTLCAHCHNSNKQREERRA